jgi:hypothetical protein
MNGKLTELFDAEVRVDTVFSLESGVGNGNRFYLSDYSTMNEFRTDCAGWFSEEDDPEYVYTDWTGIPDYLISRHWLCPNLFEIREAIRLLERSTIERFPRWCRDNGHDLTRDDPMMLATRYQDYAVPAREPDPEIEPDDNPCLEPLHSLLGRNYAAMEIFNDNYN